MELKPETKPTKPKRYRTASNKAEHIPGLGFAITNEMLQRPHVIRAIENYEKRTGKTIMGRVVVLD